MNKTIIGFSGKKKSGKNSCINFIFGNFLNQSGLIKNFAVNEDSDGELFVKTLDDVDGIFKIDDRTPLRRAYLEEEIYPIMQPFMLADVIKEVCIKLFGLDTNLVYGTDEQKNTLTEYKWEDLYRLIGVTQSKEYPNSGYMTIREILQFWGTEVMRERLDPDIHVKRTLESIEKSNAAQAYISDIRFPNEVELIQKAGGKVIRLTRNVFKDGHKSENALNDYPLEKFDAVIDNQNMTMDEMFEKLLEILDGWECL